MTRSDNLSGPECAVALLTLGFAIAGREPGRTILQSDRATLVVPDLLVLPSLLLDAILGVAGISRGALFSALEHT